MARDNGASRKGKAHEVETTPEPASVPSVTPETATVETSTVEATAKTTVNGDKVTHRFTWKPDENSDERREHTTVFDFDGMTREQLMAEFAKGRGTAFVQGKFRILAKTGSKIEARSFAEVHVVNHIINASRGSKATLTPDQAVHQAFLNSGMTPEQVAEAIAAINAIKAGKAQS